MTQTSFEETENFFENDFQIGRGGTRGFESKAAARRKVVAVSRWKEGASSTSLKVFLVGLGFTERVTRPAGPSFSHGSGSTLDIPKPSINSWPIPRRTSCVSCLRQESSRKRFSICTAATFSRTSTKTTSTTLFRFSDQVHVRRREAFSRRHGFHKRSSTVSKHFLSLGVPYMKIEIISHLRRIQSMKLERIVTLSFRSYRS